MEPLQIVTATPPIEATLRILLNSVPYLIGCAVVRQPAGPDAVAAEVGRNPWLFDRRLTTLQLPDDTLPANRAVALDWPVPYQAEWVGVPPRLLISRLVFDGRTIGVLLGTLMTREQLSAQTREALGLSCELIASAMAMYAGSAGAAAAPFVPQKDPVTAPAPTAAPSERSPEQSPAAAIAANIDSIAAEIANAVAAVDDARAMGRILRDAMNEVSEASAFSVALFHADRPEVAYRYKVVGVDAGSSELGKQPVDDSPSCFAVRNAEGWHTFDRAVTVVGERRRVGVLQMPLADRGAAFGVVTLQTFREGGFGRRELDLIKSIVAATASGFARARAGGRFQPSASAPVERVVEPVAERVPEGLAVAAASVSETTDDVLSDLLAQCASAGSATAFIVGVDPAAGLLRGDRVSGSAEARGVDRLLGISEGRFAIGADDRYNAIARACREARVVSAPTVHELVQPAHDANEAALIERLTGGGRSVIFPIVVDGDVVGALIAGPCAVELEAVGVERLGALVDGTCRRLGAAWRAATLGDASGVEVPADARRATHSEHVA